MSDLPPPYEEVCPSRKREREQCDLPLQSKRKKTGQRCLEKGCSDPRAPGVGRCSTHCRRCEICDCPISRGKWCQPCRARKEAMDKMCARPGCTGQRMPRQLTCESHTLLCRTCRAPITRGKPCNHCKAKKKDDNPTWYHESLARRVFEHALWKNEAPPCKCAKNKNKCKECVGIESCRAYYRHKGKRRWFDFDIVFKVPIPQPDGTVEWKIVLVVEIDGPSHYKALKFGKMESDIADQKLRDKLKQRYCRRKGIHMIRIPCYFGNPNGKMYPNTKKFIKLVHIGVWEAQEKLSSGALGLEAARKLRENWSDTWFRHPNAKI